MPSRSEVSIRQETAYKNQIQCRRLKSRCLFAPPDSGILSALAMLRHARALQQLAKRDSRATCSSAMLRPMRISTSQVIGTLALMISFACPILELIDTWDPPIQSGNDPEYSLVIVAVCVGMGYFFVSSILGLSRPSSAHATPSSCALLRPFAIPCSFNSCSGDTSPPGLPLRI